VPSAAKQKLSASVDGRNIKVVATASAGTTIHTAVTGVVVGTFDEIYLEAFNSSAVPIVIQVQWGNTVAPDDNVIMTIAPQVGFVPVVNGLILQNGAIVRCFASVANVIMLNGFVNAISA